jgi:16S rRNA (cytosine967-C5)-methyltransferase
MAGGRPGARAVAHSVLIRFEAGDGLLSSLTDRALNRAPWLDRRNRAFAKALAQGVVRHRRRIDWVLAALSKTPVEEIEPRVLAALRLGVFQLLHMGGVPDSAAVNTSVELVKPAEDRLVSFVNGVLRNVVRKGTEVEMPDPEKDPVLALAVEESFPDWLAERWTGRLGLERTREMCRAANAIAPNTVRVNTLEGQPEDLLRELSGHVQELFPGRYAPYAYTFIRPDVPMAELPGHSRGLFAAQDEASQLVCLLAGVKPGESVLDACAGRGGKAGYLAQLLGNQGYLAVADSDPSKLSQLEREMNRLRAMVGKNLVWDATRPPPRAWREAFDCVMVDAPCSALGVVRKHPDAKWLKGPETIIQHARLQARVLRAAAQAVKPGGRLVYAVCSTEPEEGRDVARHFLAREPEFTLVSARELLPEQALELVTPEGFLETSPDRHRIDGFFAACMRKTGGR